MELVEDVYLGDGVYAGFDGYHIWLDLRAQNEETRIALEPPVLDALFGFRQKVKAALAKVEGGGV